jgi:preprotein translocase subunit SecF
MKFLTNQTNIDFMGKHRLGLVLSMVVIIACFASFATRGLNFGIDFTGGFLIELGYQQEVDPAVVRDKLASNGFDDALVQHFGAASDVLIRIAPRDDQNQASISNTVLALVKDTSDQEIQMRRIEYVGPQVGNELRDQGGLAMLIALGGILVYVAFRFQFKSALGAILATIHDVIITVGVFSFLQMDFDLSTLAAVLAVIGYSLNDTVVVLDRIRESFRNVRKRTPIEVLNLSINQTLSRTLMTSFTTLLVVVALFFLGGEVIHSFAFALIVGIIVGTYSSIYVASATLLLMNVTKQDFLEEAKEEVVDDRP